MANVGEARRRATRGLGQCSSGSVRGRWIPSEWAGYGEPCFSKMLQGAMAYHGALIWPIVSIHDAWNGPCCVQVCTPHASGQEGGCCRRHEGRRPRGCNNAPCRPACRGAGERLGGASAGQGWVKGWVWTSSRQMAHGLEAVRPEWQQC